MQFLVYHMWARSASWQLHVAQVARRMRSASELADQRADASAKAGRRAVRYRAVGIQGDVFLHPLSALHRAVPEYVVYSQVLRTEKRPYMAGAPSDGRAQLFALLTYLAGEDAGWKSSIVAQWRSVSAGAQCVCRPVSTVACQALTNKLP